MDKHVESGILLLSSRFQKHNLLTGFFDIFETYNSPFLNSQQKKHYLKKHVSHTNCAARPTTEKQQHERGIKQQSNGLTPLHFQCSSFESVCCVSYPFTLSDSPVYDTPKKWWLEMKSPWRLWKSPVRGDKDGTEAVERSNIKVGKAENCYWLSHTRRLSSYIRLTAGGSGFFHSNKFSFLNLLLKYTSGQSFFFSWSH